MDAPLRTMRGPFFKIIYTCRAAPVSMLGCDAQHVQTVGQSDRPLRPGRHCIALGHVFAGDLGGSSRPATRCVAEADAIILDQHPCDVWTDPLDPPGFEVSLAYQTSPAHPAGCWRIPAQALGPDPPDPLRPDVHHSSHRCCDFHLARSCIRL